LRARWSGNDLLGCHNPTRQRGIAISGFTSFAVNPPLARFEVAIFTMAVDQRTENTGDYQNPTRQRGIFPGTAPTAKHNPSLTQRVGIVANAQLQI
jgi:hypothetical protein